jgi:hypothetical protein
MPASVSTPEPIRLIGKIAAQRIRAFFKLRNRSLARNDGKLAARTGIGISVAGSFTLSTETWSA